MISDKIGEPKTKEYYTDPINIDPPKNIPFKIEKRERFWDDKKDLNIVYEVNSSETKPEESVKAEAKIFDFEKEIRKFRGGKSRDHLKRSRKKFDRTYKYSV